MAMKEYRVRWEIDIFANSPEEAAEQALRVQKSVMNLEATFEVQERPCLVGGWQTINLSGGKHDANPEKSDG